MSHKTSMTLLICWIAVVTVSLCGADELRDAIKQDWALQDGLRVDGQLQISAIEKTIAQSAGADSDLRVAFDRLSNGQVPESDPRWLDLYYRACQQRPYGIYFVDADGQRELLAYDSQISCNQPIPLGPRSEPPLRSTVVDTTQDRGVYYVQDVYAGPGLAGVPRGTIRKLRVVAIRYRAAGIRRNFNEGPGGAALSSTPISIGNGAWDVKEVLGETRVYEDGSACFYVPARTPVYFQALDGQGMAVQTMRSWSTLQPGETFSCVGCHEPKHTTSLPARTTIALQAGPQVLKPFYGPPRGFSFPREIQPILDSRCVHCHSDRQRQIRWDEPSPSIPSRPAPAFSLRGTGIPEPESGRMWSEAYLALTGADFHSPRWKVLLGKPNRLVNWITAQSEPTPLPPHYAGSTRSGLITLLKAEHAGVKLSGEELKKIACWIDLGVPYCGDYREANIWTKEEVQRYEHFLNKRLRLEELDEPTRIDPNRPAPRP